MLFQINLNFVNINFDRKDHHRIVYKKGNGESAVLT